MSSMWKGEWGLVNQKLLYSEIKYPFTNFWCDLIYVVWELEDCKGTVQCLVTLFSQFVLLSVYFSLKIIATAQNPAVLRESLDFFKYILI